MFDERTRLSKDVVSEVRRHFGDRVTRASCRATSDWPRRPATAFRCCSTTSRAAARRPTWRLAREMLPALAAGPKSAGASEMRPRARRRRSRACPASARPPIAGRIVEAERKCHERDQRTTEGDRPHAQGTRPRPRRHPPAGRPGGRAAGAGDPDRADRQSGSQSAAAAIELRRGGTRGARALDSRPGRDPTAGGRAARRRNVHHRGRRTALASGAAMRSRIASGGGARGRGRSSVARAGAGREPAARRPQRDGGGGGVSKSAGPLLAHPGPDRGAGRSRADDDHQQPPTATTPGRGAGPASRRRDHAGSGAAAARGRLDPAPDRARATSRARRDVGATHGGVGCNTGRR